MLGYLALRAIPGVEVVAGSTYRRTVVVDGDPGVIEVTRGGDDHLLLRARLRDEEGLSHAARRVRLIMGLDADVDVGAGPPRHRPHGRPAGDGTPRDAGARDLGRLRDRRARHHRPTGHRDRGQHHRRATRRATRGAGAGPDPARADPHLPVGGDAGGGRSRRHRLDAGPDPGDPGIRRGGGRGPGAARPECPARRARRVHHRAARARPLDRPLHRRCASASPMPCRRPTSACAARWPTASAPAVLPSADELTARAEAWRPWRALAAVHLWSSGLAGARVA